MHKMGLKGVQKGAQVAPNMQLNLQELLAKLQKFVGRTSTLNTSSVGISNAATPRYVLTYLIKNTLSITELSIR